MSKEPNRNQKTVIESTEGIYLVDAGPGTGKTFTLTRRYLNLLENRGVAPEDVLLVTFTRNAARQMKERIIAKSPYDQAGLRDAPICTFHSFAHQLLAAEGFEAPEILGISDRIPPSLNILERKVSEEDRFRRFFNKFSSNHSQHSDLYRIIRSPDKLLGIIKSLAVKGLAPTADGWYGSTDRYLNGDFEKFEAEFDELNEPGEGKNGPTASPLRKEIRGLFNDYCFPPKTPSREELGLDRDSKRIKKALVKDAFVDDRGQLKDFIHDLYYEYLKYCLSKGYLNFNFLLLFSYLLLLERAQIREAQSYDYIMVDEFQDTNELQLKTVLLLSKNGNICVVGDWKQSIFSFRYADVDNILEFKHRLRDYAGNLNREVEKVPYSVQDLQTIELNKNYRSTQEIIDFSEHALLVKGSKKERLDRDQVSSSIVSLESAYGGEGTVEIFESEDEPKAILERVQDLVENNKLGVPASDQGGKGAINSSRTVRYGDIAVLSRTNSFALDLQELAGTYNIPAVFEGGVALFRSDPSILLLAWLRILENRSSSKGWAVVLEEAGYLLDEVKGIIEEGKYPSDMVEFAERLEALPDSATVARSVFDRYGLKGAEGSEIIKVLREVEGSETSSLSDIIGFIERQIEEGVKYSLDREPSEGSPEDHMTIKTIHSAKGLEFPVVFLADLNRGRFPSRTKASGNIFYDEILGLRKSKQFDSDRSFVCDDWKGRLLQGCLRPDYSEERRLMYVALTRAEKHLFVSADSEHKSRFFTDLADRTGYDVRSVGPEPVPIESTPPDREDMCIEVPSDSRPVSLSAGDLISGRKGAGEGGSRELGDRVHEFAQSYVKKSCETDPSIDSDNQQLKNHLERTKAFLDKLKGDLRAEVKCYLPLENPKFDRILVKGRIDLIVENEGEIRIVDYKTTATGSGIEEYRKQLSVYYHTIKAQRNNSGKSIKAEVYYTESGTRVSIDPLSLDELSQLCEEVVAERRST